MSFTVTANVTRSVSERASGGVAVGNPVAGTPYDDGDDQTDDALTHTLTGEATDAFVIDAATGQISVAQGATLDHDTKDSYTGQVEYTVQGQAAVVNLTIKVTDVHPPLTPEAPSVTGSATDPTDTLDVGWTEPDTSGNRPITDYDVRYRVVGADGWTQHPHNGTATDTAIGRRRGRNHLRGAGAGPKPWRQQRLVGIREGRNRRQGVHPCAAKPGSGGFQRGAAGHAHLIHGR